MSTDQQLSLARNTLASARSICALTGAGVSAASGLGLFRTGVADDQEETRQWLEWRHYRKDPTAHWGPLYQQLYRPLLDAAPNRAHDLLASWGPQLQTVVTQNVDGLHQQAGSKQVIELHGSLHRTFCWRCRRRASYPTSAWSAEVPRCGSCGKPVKPDIVFYGEKVWPKAFETAQWATMVADVLLVIGTSCAVYPAALLPEMCRRGGGVVIEINPGASELRRDLVDIAIPLPAIEALERLLGPR